MTIFYACENLVTHLKNFNDTLHVLCDCAPVEKQSPNYRRHLWTTPKLMTTPEVDLTRLCLPSKNMLVHRAQQRNQSPFNFNNNLVSIETLNYEPTLCLQFAKSIRRMCVPQSIYFCVHMQRDPRFDLLQFDLIFRCCFGHTDLINQIQICYSSFRSIL